MKIEFGIMTTKYSMEATTLKVGKVAIALFIGTNVPIAVYNPSENSFLPSTVIHDLEMSDSMAKNVKKAHDSIKKMPLPLTHNEKESE